MRYVTLIPLVLLAMTTVALGQALTPPVLTEAAQPEYPPAASQARLDATVVFHLDIDSEGQVEGVRWVQTSTRAHVRHAVVAPEVVAQFQLNAETAARRLRFSPAQVDGVAVPVSLQYTFTFLAPEAAPTPPQVSPQAVPPPIINLRGVVRAAGTRRRLSGALVIAKQGEEAFEATTGPQGDFRFFNLGVGEWTLLIDASGHRTGRDKQTIVQGELLEVSYYLQPSPENTYDVVVQGERVEREVTRRTLSTQAAATVAGTMGDPVLALTDLPGVAQAGPGGGRPVRGSSPQDTRFYVEGVGVLIDEHVGGFRSVLPSQMVQEVEFYPGNFSVKYGRGMGGVVDVKLKELAPDQLHGAFDVSLLDAGLYLEAPLGDKAAIAVAGRRSYIDVILGAAIPEDSDVKLTTAPRWYDYQLLLDWRPAPAHQLRLFGLGADDAMELFFDNVADVDPDASQPTARQANNSQRASLQYRFTPSRTFSNDLRIAMGRDAGQTSVFGRFTLGFRFLNLTLRDEARLHLHKTLNVTVGVDARLEASKYDVHAFRPPKEGQSQDTLPPEQESLDAAGTRTDPYVAGFVEAEWTPTQQLTVIPGVRVDYFGMGRATTFDPRLMLRYALHPQLTLKAGVGLVHQAPELDEAIAPFGNPDIGPARALQTSVGAKWQPLDFLSGEVTLFYKHLDHLVRPVDDADIYRNEGRGRVAGLEVFVRQQLAFGLSGWLSYTLSRSERTDGTSVGQRLFDYDQTHILSLVARYELPANWSVGARWRLVSGRPVTPFVGGVFQEDRDAYEGLKGAPNSERLPMFHMLDLRVDKRWVFDQWALSTYLSVSNTYNRANAQDISYSFDYRQKEVVAGLPILPILGVTGTF